MQFAFAFRRSIFAIFLYCLHCLQGIGSKFTRNSPHISSLVSSFVTYLSYIFANNLIILLVELVNFYLKANFSL